jgi:SSS family solute:Na+ symporter
MANRTLNTMQVGAMLTSTSCGIGFLLGTGELAVHQGMAGCLYAVATALGLMFLAVCAPTLWTVRQSIWNQLDQLHGASVGRNVALLSLVWMTGVLAAQIRGGAAVLALIGLPRTTAVLLIVALLVALSLVSLSWLSAGFAICLLACNVVLVHSLIGTRRIDVWLYAPVSFAMAIQHSAPAHTGFILLSVAVMVVYGADYQQFMIAARTPSIARAGCLLAAAFVFAIGFLPASAVIATGINVHWQGVADPVQIVPVLLIHSLPDHWATAAQDLVTIVLVTTALGSASSILRAMSDATATLSPPSIMRPVWSRALPVLLATLVASRSQSLINMMVDLNVVYIAAVGPLMVLSVLRIRVSDSAANAAMVIACAISLGGYLIRWTTSASIPEAAPLIVSIAVAFAVAVSHRPHVVSPPGRRRHGAPQISVRPHPQPSPESPPGCSSDADSG